jgi:cytochrome c-type biogenesis protein CcmH/NrfF
MTNRFECSIRVLVLLVLLVASAQGQPDQDNAESLQDPKTEAAAYEIAQRTMSPFCPGRTLADCPSDKAAAWRQDIRRMLLEGKSAAEIHKALNERSGVNLSGTPESIVGWALPVGLLIGGGTILGIVFFRFRQRDEDEDRDEDGKRGEDGDQDEDGKRSKSTRPPADDDLDARLDRELEQAD